MKLKLLTALGLFTTAVIPLVGCAADLSLNDESQSVQDPTAKAERKAGKNLFDNETFGGNGRTCLTCHSRDTGTFTPEDAQTRYAAQTKKHHDPLFVGDGTDDGNGNGVTRILANATIRITIALPDNISIQDDPTARSVTFNRSVPTTLNTPSLDPVLMWDGRAPTLEAQAAGAIHDHAEATREPTAEELADIAAFEQSNKFFTSRTLRLYARGRGPAPTLPNGTTDSEIRGQRFFVPQPITVDPATGLHKLDGFCAHCHAGPMLNTSSGFNPNFPLGVRFSTARVSQNNKGGNPLHVWVVQNADGTTTTSAPSPDPGCILIPSTGCQTEGPIPLAGKILQGFFKTPTLWDVGKTAPYFHDNSAATLGDVIDEYALMFQEAGGNNVLTAQDKEDILAYMALLNLYDSDGTADDNE